MIITPTATPAALIDQSNVNLNQQQQAQSAELSRKASVTVQFSPQARELAGTDNNDAPQPQKQDTIQNIATEPEATTLSTTNQATVSVEARAPVQQQVEALVSKQVNEAVESNKQQPIHPTSKQPESTKIDVLA